MTATDAPIDRLNSATADLDPPLLAADVAAIDANLAALVRRAGGTPIRVASKSVRVRAVLDRALATPGFAGIMAWSLREALWSECDDVLMGYPTVDRGALGQLASDSAAAQRITLMVDSTAHLELLESVGPWASPPQVCLDVDASLRLGPAHIGVRRSPLRTPDDVVRLGREASRRGMAVQGVMFYEAQIAGLPDSGRAVRWMKRRSAGELAYRRAAVVDALRDAVGPLRIVNSGGTGSLEISAADPSVTEVTAGSGIFAPTLFDGYDAFTPTPALFFALPVVRTPTSRIATAFSGGYIASGPTGRSRVPSIVGPGRLLRTEGVGEVQTPIVGSGASLGDRVWFRHAKAGEVCERFDVVHLVENGARTTVPTYRGEGRTFG
ncbi:amino acid deaminase/aldolase [Rhodococcoides corynebacterioides]|uniref:amino acid deaminase/aldolase n=1 Tax=Rhodococcoides corynebacterioides TaxID=53972 RepID=UPI003F7FC999